MVTALGFSSLWHSQVVVLEYFSKIIRRNGMLPPCTARYVHSVSANPKNTFLSESSSQNLEVVVFSASANTKFYRK